jgi:hypothetical protein
MKERGRREKKKKYDGSREICYLAGLKEEEGEHQPRNEDSFWKMKKGKEMDCTLEFPERNTTLPAP